MNKSLAQENTTINFSNELLKKELQKVLNELNVWCEKSTTDNPDGTSETKYVLKGGQLIDHRWTIFIPIKDAFT